MREKEIINFTFPGDKSIAHRLVLISLLFPQKINIKNLPKGKDVITSLKIVKQLGVNVINTDDTSVVLYGQKNKVVSGPLTLDCGNSGTTARLLCGILANYNGLFKLVGDESLSKRPMDRVVKPLADLMDISISSNNGYLPVLIRANGKSKAINYNNLTGSAQVKSAILFAGRASAGKTIVNEKIPSRDHTERLIKYISSFKETDEYTFEIPGDISSAAYIAIASLITGKRIKISNVLLNPTRIGFLNVLKRMGADIEVTVTSDIWEPVGDLLIKSGKLNATDIAFDEIPSVIDELPILAIAMVFAEGKSTVRGAKELRVKESDRIRCLITQLAKIGVVCKEYEDGYEIFGSKTFHDCSVDSFGDHRLAMSFAILEIGARIKLEIKNIESVDVSFPEFKTYLSYFL